MEKRTVIANIRAEISLTDDMQAFFNQFKDQKDIWFARQEGNAFLAEFGHDWDINFTKIAQSNFDAYFRSVGLSENRLPEVKLTDSHSGSWIMEAALTMFGTVGTTYTILKAISELPKIADGIEETKKRLQEELSAIFKKKIPERIEPIISNSKITAQLPESTRKNPVSVTCSIDARPLRALTPDAAKSHSIHLAVAVSRSALSVENLGETTIDNLNIGLFKSETQKHNWNFSEAFSKHVPRLSGKQSTSLSIDQFKLESTGSELDLTDEIPLYVDCWLQDKTGIYLFNFYLE